MTPNSKQRLSFSAFITWVEGWRAKRGMRQLTDDEYDDLYERFLSAKSHTLERMDAIELIEAQMAEAGSRKTTPEEREANRAELRRRPPERQRLILEMVRIIVERHKLNQSIAAGKARPN